MDLSAESSVILKTVDLLREFRTGGETIEAVKDVNINVGSGKLTILRGRSGSGKTTLLNLLGAMDIPTRGEVYFCGRNLTKLPDSARDKIRRTSMGFVFQSCGLMSYMSAYENVDFGLRIAGCSTQDRKTRAEECLTLVGLGKRMNHRPYEMSGGEQQRVAIARAFAHRPKIIFADEPTSALDTAMGLQIVKIFKELIEKEGITIVMTTHDPSMVDVVDDVITLEDGEAINER
jgi:putative ABC transport system ATP-binding protein